MSRLWKPCSTIFCVHLYVLPAGLLQTSVWGEELVTALPLPDLGRPGPWSLLHHLLALYTLEPGPVPMQTPGQHVDRKSLLKTKCVCGHAGPPLQSQTQVMSLMSMCSTILPLFSLLFVSPLFTSQPPFIPLSHQWPVSDTTMSTYPQARGPLGPAWPGPLTWWEATHGDTSQEKDSSALLFRRLSSLKPANCDKRPWKHVRCDPWSSIFDTCRDTDSHTPTLLHCVCVGQCVFVPFVSLPRALGGCPVSEPLVWPLRGKRYHSSGILAASGPCVNSFHTHINTNTHMHALPTSPAKHTHCPPTS